MERRELLAMAGLMTIAGSVASTSSALAQGQGELKAKLIHIYNTPDGESHVEIVEIANSAGAIPVTAMTASAYERNETRAEDWHTAPRNQFAINLTGTLEVEVSNGIRQEIGQGDLVFLEDTTGVGHVTRVKTSVTNLFIQVEQDWDMRAWAKG